MTLNKPNPRLAILRAQLAAEADAIKLQRFRYKMSNAIGCSCPVPAPDADSLPLPPSYWEDLEHWLKTLAPAKPAAPALDAGCAHEWVRGIDLPLAERFGLWHYRADQWHKPGNVFDAIEIDDDGEYRRAPLGAKLGDRYDESKYATAGMNKRHAAIYAEHVDEKHGVVWRSGPTIPEIERVGLWHYKTVSDGTVGVAEQGSSFSFDCPGEYRPAAPGTKYGDPYDESKYVTADLTARLASTSSADGAALLGEKQAHKAVSTHSVCVKAYVGATGFAYEVGYVCLVPFDEIQRIGGDKKQHWLPCDDSGWVTHTPEKLANSPVPEGVLCIIKHDDGSVCGDTKFNPPRTGNDWFGWDSIIIAWRPIADGSK